MILGVMIFVNAAIVLFRIGNKDFERNIKKYCIKTTTGKIESHSKGLILNSINISEARCFSPRPYTYSLNLTMLYHTTYSYTVNEKQYLGIDARKHVSVLPAGKAGDVVEIFYNPNDAREFYCPNEDRNAKYGYLILILLFDLLMVGIFVGNIVINR